MLAQRVFSLTAVLLFVPGTLVLSQGLVSRDIDYLPESHYENGRDLLDIYMPEASAPVPVVVYFHPGALRAGDKAMGALLAQRLVPLGIGVISANYRLSPWVMHPAHVQDAAAATAWVIRNVADYGGDPEQVYVSGHSAGAYLAALIVADPNHLGGQGIELESVQGSIPISAFLYVEETARDRPKDVWGSEPSDWLAASVTPHIDTASRPMLLIYADGDEEWRRRQNERFAEAVRASGNDAVSVVEVPNRDHVSLLNELNAPDDRIGDLIREFVMRR